MSTAPANAVVTYPALVGQVVARIREARGIKQGDFASALGMSQSAYSRLESGDSVANLSQLRNIALQLGMDPSELLLNVDGYAGQLMLQGVQVISEKTDYSAAVALGLGLLAAVLLGGR